MAKKSHHSNRLIIFGFLTAIAIVIRSIFKHLKRRVKTAQAREVEHAYLNTTSDRDHCDIEGLRFLAGAIGAQTLNELTNQECLDPIRIYAGIKSGNSPEERVGWALDEMDLLDAWERDIILVITPTGRGYVHPIPLEALEISHSGNTACVAIQYANDRSMRAIGKLDDGILAHALLLEAIYERLDERRRRNMSVPIIGVYGESMGAWGSLEAMLDLSKLPDRGLWAGAPAPVRKRTLPRVANRIHADGGFFMDSATSPAGVVPYLSLTNDDDPIAYFEGIKTFIIPTRWARRRKFWMPGYTWAKLIVEIEAQTRPERGVMGMNKHDYRGHMPLSIPLVFGGKELNAEQIEWLTKRERSRHQDFAFLYTLPVKA